MDKVYSAGLHLIGVQGEGADTAAHTGLQINRFILFLQFNNNLLVHNNMLGCNMTPLFPSKVFGIGDIWDDRGNKCIMRR